MALLAAMACTREPPARNQFAKAGADAAAEAGGLGDDAGADDDSATELQDSPGNDATAQSDTGPMEVGDTDAEDSDAGDGDAGKGDATSQDAGSDAGPSTDAGAAQVPAGFLGGIVTAIDGAAGQYRVSDQGWLSSRKCAGSYCAIGGILP